MVSEKQEKNNESFQAKYRQMEAEEVRYEAIQCDDAEYIIVAYGVSARISQKAVDILRAEGIKVGLFGQLPFIPFPKTNHQRNGQPRKRIHDR
jgi:2-oxoglutarate/2-oxoacid ferredoxin oxidoreductase subunit alpha